MVEKTEAKIKKVLITGSNGMLGTDLCESLSDCCGITGIDLQDNTYNKNKDTNFLLCDITNKSAVKKVLSDTDPDIIIHCAAWTDVDGCQLYPDKAENVNYQGTVNLIETAESAGKPFFFISTDFVFNGKKNALYNEYDSPDPINVYGETKFKAENRVKKYENYCIIRTSWLYGRHGKNFINTILKKAAKSETIPVVDDQAGCPTYTKDLSGAIKNLIKWYFADNRAKAVNEIFHISNKEAVSWYTYAKEIFRLAEIDADIRPVKSCQLEGRPAERPAFSGLDAGKYERTTKQGLRSWKQALKEYLNEEKSYQNT